MDKRLDFCCDNHVSHTPGCGDCLQLFLDFHTPFNKVKIPEPVHQAKVVEKAEVLEPESFKESSEATYAKIWLGITCIPFWIMCFIPHLWIFALILYFIRLSWREKINALPFQWMN